MIKHFRPFLFFFVGNIKRTFANYIQDDINFIFFCQLTFLRRACVYLPTVSRWWAHASVKRYKKKIKLKLKAAQASQEKY